MRIALNSERVSEGQSLAHSLTRPRLLLLVVGVVALPHTAQAINIGERRNLAKSNTTRTGRPNMHLPKYTRVVY